jgi:hypothetical protein
MDSYHEAKTHVLLRTSHNGEKLCNLVINGRRAACFVVGLVAEA